MTVIGKNPSRGGKRPQQRQRQRQRSQSRLYFVLPLFLVLAILQIYQVHPTIQVESLLLPQTPTNIIRTTTNSTNNIRNNHRRRRTLPQVQQRHSLPFQFQPPSQRCQTLISSSASSSIQPDFTESPFLYNQMSSSSSSEETNWLQQFPPWIQQYVTWHYQIRQQFPEWSFLLIPRHLISLFEHV